MEIKTTKGPHVLVHKQMLKEMQVAAAKHDNLVDAVRDFLKSEYGLDDDMDGDLCCDNFELIRLAECVS